MSYDVPRLTLSPTDAAYLAGLIDGEGSLFLARRKASLLASLNITMTHRETLEWCWRRCGGGLYGPTIRRMPSGELARPIWIWKVTSMPRCIAVLDAVLPYLIAKHQAADELLAYCHQRIKYMQVVGKQQAEVRPVDLEYLGRLRALSFATTFAETV